MNPLIALLTPQLGKGDILPALGTPAVGGKGAGALVNGIAIGATGGAAVQVDSSSFLSVLAATNAQSANAVNQIAQTVNDTKAFNDPLAELSTYLNGVRGEAGGDINVSGAKRTLDKDTLVNLQTLPQKGSEVNAAVPTDNISLSSIKTVAENVIGDQRGVSPASVASDPSKTDITLDGNAAKIVRHVAQNVNFASNGLAASALAINNVQAQQSQKGYLSNSSKLLNEFEGGYNVPPPPTEDAEVLINKELALNKATKAYLSIDGNDPADFELNSNVKLGGKEFLQDGLLSSVGKSDGANGVTLNNVTAVDSLKALENSHAASAEAAKRSHHAYQQNPAEQAAVKIAAALNEGVRHVHFELEPARLGHLEVKMELSQEGTSRLIVFVEKPETLQLIKNDHSILERALNDAGFKTNSDSLSFNLKNGGEGNNLAGQGSDGSGRGGGNIDGNEIANNESLLPGMEYILDISNGVVDMFA